MDFLGFRSPQKEELPNARIFFTIFEFWAPGGTHFGFLLNSLTFRISKKSLTVKIGWGYRPKKIFEWDEADMRTLPVWGTSFFSTHPNWERKTSKIFPPHHWQKIPKNFFFPFCKDFRPFVRPSVSSFTWRPLFEAHALLLWPLITCMDPISSENLIDGTQGNSMSCWQVIMWAFWWNVGGKMKIISVFWKIWTEIAILTQGWVKKQV